MTGPMIINAGDVDALTAALKGDAGLGPLSIEYVPAKRLKLYPGNARKGNVPEIEESIDENGFYSPLIVQRSTRRILAGNHRYKAGVSQGLEEFPVVWLDVDDKRAAKIVLVDNKTSDDATYDVDKLIALLSPLAEDDDLVGTGFSDDELDKLMNGLDTGEDDDPEPGDLGEQKTTTCPSCGHEF